VKKNIGIKHKEWALPTSKARKPLQLEKCPANDPIFVFDPHLGKNVSGKVVPTFDL